MDKIQNSCSGSSRSRGVCILAVCLALGVTQLTTCHDGGSVDDSGPAAQAPGGGGPADGSAPAAMPSDLRRAFIAARMAEAGQEHAFGVRGDGAGAFAASSPEQSLAFALGPSGLAVMPAGGDTGSWRADVRLVGVGRPELLFPVHEALPEAEGNRVTYRRGPVEEWYRSGPPGLEQGFDVRERPEGDGPRRASATAATASMTFAATTIAAEATRRIARPAPPPAVPPRKRNPRRPPAAAAARSRAKYRE
jgi:hypothetical protein